MVTLLLIIPLIGSILILLKGNNNLPLNLFSFLFNKKKNEQFNYSDTPIKKVTKEEKSDINNTNLNYKLNTSIEKYYSNSGYRLSTQNVPSNDVYNLSIQNNKNLVDIKQNNQINDINLVQLNNSSSQIKKIALTTALINFFISIYIWYQFDSSITQFQFCVDYGYNSDLMLSSIDNLQNWIEINYFQNITNFLNYYINNIESMLYNFINLIFIQLYILLYKVKLFLLEFNLINYNVVELYKDIKINEDISLQEELLKNTQYFNLKFGIDGISLYFVLLTTFITPIAIMSNYSNINNNLKSFLISMLLLETLQICAFVSLDLMLFYIFFESVLPIIFIVIIIFGHGEDRFRSAYFFFLFTLAGSLPMLLCILTLYSYIGSTDFNVISLYDISLDYQKILWLGFFIAFAVKTPLVPFHIWLPKAHSDSVLSGSVILAATILKLATYGYMRILINFLPDASHYFSPLIQTIAIISLIYASLSTIIQQDTKKLIAYSSIAHMAVVVLGLFSNSIQGIEGAILLSLAHGFVSPALFICVGGILYDRTHKRDIHYFKGLASYMPVFTILFFIFTLANTGVPLSLNFLGEQLSLLGIFEKNPIISALGATSIILSACYSIFLYNRISYGSLSIHLSPLKDIDRREYYILLALLIPTFLLGIFPNVILESIHLSVSTLLYDVNVIN